MKDCVDSACQQAPYFPWFTILDAYTDSAMGICDKTLNNTIFSFSCTHKKRQFFCKISSDVAPENGKRWAYGLTMDHLSTKTTRVCRVWNVWTLLIQKNRQSGMPTISQKRTPKLLQGPFITISRCIQSCQIPENDKTVTTQRRSWMYRPSGHTTQKQLRFDVVMPLSLRRVPVEQNRIYMYAY